MLSFFGWKWANVFFYIFLIWICSGLLLHLCIFHIYITLNDLTTYEYVRAQRDETGRDRYRILPNKLIKREETGRDRYIHLQNIWWKRNETGRDRYRILPKISGKREITGRDRYEYIHFPNIRGTRVEIGRGRYSTYIYRQYMRKKRRDRHRQVQNFTQNMREKRRNWQRQQKFRGSRVWIYSISQWCSEIYF